MRLSQLLWHGVRAGAAAGIVAALMLWLVVQPSIRRAIAIEESRGGGGHHGAEEAPLVERGQQVVAGGLTALVVAVLVGVVFAVVFAKARHRLPGDSDHVRALALAAMGFGAITLLPMLKIPANPPAVGDPETVNERTLIYLAALLCGVLVVGATFAVARRASSLPPALRTLLGAVVAVAGVAAVLLLVPNSPDAIASDVPPDLIWNFRLGSLAQLGAMWLTLGLVFGALVEGRAPARATVPAGAVEAGA